MLSGRNGLSSIPLPPSLHGAKHGLGATHRSTVSCDAGAPEPQHRCIHHEGQLIMRAILGAVLVAGTVVALAGQTATYVPKQSDRPEPVTGDEPGFRSIFDGKVLAGWEGNPTYWRVENGTLVGEITP